MCKARRWLDAPHGTGGMFAGFREETKGMRQVLISSVNKGEGRGVGGNNRRRSGWFSLRVPGSVEGESQRNWFGIHQEEDGKSRKRV